MKAWGIFLRLFVWKQFVLGRIGPFRGRLLGVWNEVWIALETSGFHC